MKIAITTTGENLDAPMDERFGRAAKFLIYDTEKKSFDVVNNGQNLNAPQGAGIQAAQNVAAAGADCVISGHCGPKAFRVLNEAGIKVYNTNARTAGEALEQYNKGELKEISSANVEGHWA